MEAIDMIGLEDFLREYPRMAIRPSVGTHLRLKGTFGFVAIHPVHGRLQDAFELQIDVPAVFPRDLPKIVEVGRRIPRHGDFHINGDGSLCLGSPLRLLAMLNEKPTLSAYAERCLVPHLYAVAKKLADGGQLVFGELAHFAKGMLEDYANLLSLSSVREAHRALEMLSIKKRVANKLACPCGCSRPLGRCKFNLRLLRLRRLASRSWFRQQLRYL